MITLDDIIKTQNEISTYIFKTPQVHSIPLSKNNQNVYLKLESMQITGSFKLRGAVNKLLSLSEDQKSRGVVAVSTGNHGKGVAYTASKLGIKSIIYVPNNITEARKKAIKDLGAEVVVVNGSYDDSINEVKKKSIENNWLGL